MLDLGTLLITCFVLGALCATFVAAYLLDRVRDEIRAALARLEGRRDE